MYLLEGESQLFSESRAQLPGEQEPGKVSGLEQADALGALARLIGEPECRHVAEFLFRRPTTIAIRPPSVATLAAISEAHRVAGQPSPRKAPEVREVWKGIAHVLAATESLRP